MKSIITINKNKCRKDYACIGDCPLGLLEKDADGYPVQIFEAEKSCIDCGHCVTVCPEGALDQRKMRASECTVVDNNLNLSAEQIEQLLSSRRSVRQYKEKQVEPEKIKRLLEAASYAPSGHNSQPAKWLLINGKENIRGLAGIVADWMHVVIVEQPALAKAILLEQVVAAWDVKKDMILRSAPNLIIGYAPKDERRAPAAIVTAIAYLELLAPALGLGTCWAGYFTGACQTYEPLKKAIALPAGQAVYGALMVGYSKVKYSRIPKRKSIDMTLR